MEFLSTLAELKNGRVIHQANDTMQRLLSAVQKHGGKGKLGLELTLSPRIDSDTGRVIEVDIAYSIKVAEPQPNHGTTMFYVDKEGKLTRQDPRQAEMFEEEVTFDEPERNR